jgi:DNA-binding MarR family transcriptional regulator
MNAHDQLVTEALDHLDALVALRRRQFCTQQSFRGVSLPQLHILMTVQERRRMTVSELGQLLQISAPSTSAILDRMEEHRLVHRVRDAADRRVVHVEVSERGTEVVEGFIGMKRDEMRAMLDVMTDDELSHMGRALHAIGRVIGGDSDVGNRGAA